MARHLYIHVPFCNYICTFCDFKRDLIFKHDVPAFVDKVIAALAGPYETVYLGGGTPNALPYEQLQRLLAAIKPTFAANYELTVEANPDSVTEQQAHMMFAQGVNRVSLGAQTTNDAILATTNRHHTTKQTEQAVAMLHAAGIANVSLDFIYNLPFMKEQDLTNAVDLLAKTGVTHASFYSLELKEGSIMTKQKRVRIDPEEEERQLLFLIDLLDKEGFERYEVANWAKNGARSRHNMAYWLSEEWQAIGYGAWGFENRSNYHFDGSIGSWTRIDEPLSDKDYHFQVLMMGLRLAQGLDLTIERNKQAVAYYKDKLDANVVYEHNRLRCKDLNTLHDALLPLL